jgi:hypothetical protein
MATKGTLVIDNDLRTIKIPANITNIGTVSDDDVLRLKFSMPRYYGENDLGQFAVYVNYLNANGESDIYTVTDLEEKVGGTLEFTWLVSRFVNQYSGDVRFSVCLKKTNSATRILEKEFNTTIATLPVLKGIEPGKQIIQKFPDIVEQWKEELFNRFSGKIDPTLRFGGMAADAGVTGRKIDTLEKSISSPYNFRGTVTSKEVLANIEYPAINDTYFCIYDSYRYTWNGSGWYQSSLDESRYMDELLAINNISNPLVYVTNNGTVKSEPDGTGLGGVNLIFDDKLYIIVPGFNNNEAFDMSWDTVCSEISEDRLSVVGDKQVIQIDGHQMCLSFDVSDGKLRIHHIGSMDRNRICLAEVGYDNIVGGELLPLINRKKTEALESQIEDLPRLSHEVDAYHRTDDFYLYTSSDSPITIVKGSNGELIVTFNGTLNYRGVPIDLTTEEGRAQYAETMSWENLTSELSKGTIDGNKFTYSLNSYRCLVFDVLDMKIYDRNHDNDMLNTIPLIQNGWSNLAGGVLLPLVNKYDIADLKGTVSDLKGAKPDETKLTAFAKLVNDTDVMDSFIFFTDPHLTEGSDYRAEFYEYLNTIAAYYNEAPVDFCVCGGDWLGNSDTQEEACRKLALIHSTTRSKFDRMYHVIGNHDTNYQGYINSESTEQDGVLSDNTIRNLLFRNEGKPYYTFDANNTRFFVFDTGVDWDWITGASTIGDDEIIEEEIIPGNEYKGHQYPWFVQELNKCDGMNIVLIMHIVYNKKDDGSLALHPVASSILSIADDYNSRKSMLYLDGLSYDFTKATGNIRFVMGGHIHYDHETRTRGGIPIVITTETTEGNTPTFDMCLVDYDDNKLHLIRVGSGEDRVIDI